VSTNVNNRQHASRTASLFLVHAEKLGFPWLLLAFLGFFAAEKPRKAKPSRSESQGTPWLLLAFLGIFPRRAAAFARSAP
jgi:hypothetical protein